jgi:hypothetical protein
MSKNPIVNAISAFLYILLVAGIMRMTTTLASHPDTFVAPLAVLSLFTFSAAVMGYIFCYQPVMLYLDGKKKQAVKLFAQTVLGFGVITLGILIVLFSRIF